MSGPKRPRRWTGSDGRTFEMRGSPRGGFIAVWDCGSDPTRDPPDDNLAPWFTEGEKITRTRVDEAGRRWEFTRDFARAWAPGLDPARDPPTLCERLRLPLKLTRRPMATGKKALDQPLDNELDMEQRLERAVAKAKEKDVARQRVAFELELIAWDTLVNMHGQPRGSARGQAEALVTARADASKRDNPAAGNKDENPRSAKAKTRAEDRVRKRMRALRSRTPPRH